MSSAGSDPAVNSDHIKQRDGSSARIAIFASFSGQGGVERMLVNLVAGMVEQGVAVDLLLARADGPFVEQLPATVRVIRLRARHTATSVPELVRYLRRERPPVLLAAKDRAIRAAIRARWLARVDTRIVGRLGTNLGAALAHKSRLTAWSRQAPMRRAYRRVDKIIAVSDGVAADTQAVTDLPFGRIEVVRNPVVTPQIFAAAEEPFDHSWLEAESPPVIVGMGRLTPQKDFDTLLAAFAQLSEHLDCRLLIAGDGPGRAALEDRIETLGLRGLVALIGFVGNPAAVLSRADLFVLSSRWEGSPNVLTEALALGTPVVATNCPSGPNEILADGRYGPLVPVGDAAALAEAMDQTLQEPLPAERLQAAVADYNAETAAKHYLEILKGD